MFTFPLLSSGLYDSDVRRHLLTVVTASMHMRHRMEPLTEFQVILVPALYESHNFYMFFVARLVECRLEKLVISNIVSFCVRSPLYLAHRDYSGIYRVKHLTEYCSCTQLLYFGNPNLNRSYKSYMECFINPFQYIILGDCIQRVHHSNSVCHCFTIL